MTDKNGKEVTAGARCLFYGYSREKWLRGTVRSIKTEGPWAGHARVVDGDPINDDLHTNGFRISTWIKPEHIEVVGDET